MNPLLSVIIPTYNRALFLERCLECLSKQTFPAERFEVIVIDDGSSDGTAAVLTRKNFPFHFRPVFQEHGGAAPARNRGIRLAKGDILVFTDDDCLPAPDFLRRHEAAHRQGAVLARGPVLIVRSPAEGERVKPSILDYSMNFFCTSNASLPKQKILETGGFDETFDRWEDAELGFRLRQKGLRRVFLREAVVHHLKPARRLGAVIETARKDAAAARKLYRKHPALRTWFASGLHPLNSAAARVLKPWVDRKIARMNPDDAVSGIWERLVFHRYFAEGLKNA